MPMKVYEAGDLLWALEQGGRWYLASTEDCRLQAWDKPDPQALGPLVGTFLHREGVLVFEPASRPASCGELPPRRAVSCTEKSARQSLRAARRGEESPGSTEQDAG